MSQPVTNTNTELPTDRLAKLIEAKLACLVQLRNLGQRQAELIAAGEMVALLDVLAAKQRTISTLSRIEEAIDPFRAEDPDARQWRTPEDRATAAQRSEQCAAILGEIVALEKRSESDLTQRRDNVQQQLQGLHSAANAHGAYNAGNSRSKSGNLEFDA